MVMPKVTQFPDTPIILSGYETPIDFTGNLKLGIYTAELTQRYKYGTPAIGESDGSLFRYGLATTGGVASEFGAVNTHGGGTNHAGTICSAVAPAQTGDATGLVGCMAILVTVAATDGESSNGIVAANELIGGKAIINNGSSQHPDTRTIIGNTAVATGTMTVYLSAPLYHVCGSGGGSTSGNGVAGNTAIYTGVSNIEILANPYSAIANANYTNSAYTSVICVPSVTANATYNFWGRRRGPVWITSDSNTNKTANSRALYFQQNGSLTDGYYTTFTGYHPLMQYAGYAIEKTANSYSGPPLCFLQLE